MDKDMLLKYLGYELLPSSINIYVDNLKDKKVVIDKLDEYSNWNVDYYFRNKASKVATK